MPLLTDPVVFAYSTTTFVTKSTTNSLDIWYCGRRIMDVSLDSCTCECLWREDGMLLLIIQLKEGNRLTAVHLPTAQQTTIEMRQWNSILGVNMQAEVVVVQNAKLDYVLSTVDGFELDAVADENVLVARLSDRLAVMDRPGTVRYLPTNSTITSIDSFALQFDIFKEDESPYKPAFLEYIGHLRRNKTLTIDSVTESYPPANSSWAALKRFLKGQPPAIVHYCQLDAMSIAKDKEFYTKNMALQEDPLTKIAWEYDHGASIETIVKALAIPNPSYESHPFIKCLLFVCTSHPAIQSIYGLSKNVEMINQIFWIPGTQAPKNMECYLPADYEPCIEKKVFEVQALIPETKSSTIAPRHSPLKIVGPLKQNLLRSPLPIRIVAQKEDLRAPTFSKRPASSPLKATPNKNFAKRLHSSSPYTPSRLSSATNTQMTFEEETLFLKEDQAIDAVMADLEAESRSKTPIEHPMESDFEIQSSVDHVEHATEQNDEKNVLEMAEDALKEYFSSEADLLSPSKAEQSEKHSKTLDEDESMIKHPEQEFKPSKHEEIPRISAQRSRSVSPKKPSPKKVQPIIERTRAATLPPAFKVKEASPFRELQVENKTFAVSTPPEAIFNSNSNANFSVAPVTSPYVLRRRERWMRKNLAKKAPFNNSMNQ